MVSREDVPAMQAAIPEALEIGHIAADSGRRVELRGL
jgi:hypothetical protein